MFCLLNKLLRLLAIFHAPPTLSLSGVVLRPIQTFPTFLPAQNFSYSLNRVLFHRPFFSQHFPSDFLLLKRACGWLFHVAGGWLLLRGNVALDGKIDGLSRLGRAIGHCSRGTDGMLARRKSPPDPPGFAAHRLDLLVVYPVGNVFRPRGH